MDQSVWHGFEPQTFEALHDALRGLRIEGLTSASDTETWWHMTIWWHVLVHAFNGCRILSPLGSLDYMHTPGSSHQGSQKLSKTNRQHGITHTSSSPHLPNAEFALAPVWLCHFKESWCLLEPRLLLEGSGFGFWWKNQRHQLTRQKKENKTGMTWHDNVILHPFLSRNFEWSMGRESQRCTGECCVKSKPGGSDWGLARRKSKISRRGLNFSGFLVGVYMTIAIL